MERRNAIRLLMTPFLLCVPIVRQIAEASVVREMEIYCDRYFLIYDARHASPNEFLSEIGTFIAPNDTLWRRKLKLLDVYSSPNEVAYFLRKFGPNTVLTNEPVLVRVHQSLSFEPEIEVWTNDWIDSAKDRITDACYPISTGWWSVEGDWHPTRQKVKDHLFKSPNHTDGKFEKSWLDLLKYEELQSLHSDHHREMIGEGHVTWDDVNEQCPSYLK